MRFAALNDLFEAAGKCSLGAKTLEQIALALALEINKTCGQVSDSVLERTRAAGISDEQIVEIILATVQNTFTHIVNNLTKTPCEFPEIPSIE